MILGGYGAVRRLGRSGGRVSILKAIIKNNGMVVVGGQTVRLRYIRILGIDEREMLIFLKKSMKNNGKDEISYIKILWEINNILSYDGKRVSAVKHTKKIVLCITVYHKYDCL